MLVTGGAGFIGSALVRELLKEEANVIVYDNFLNGDRSNLAEVGDQIHIVNGDILSWKMYAVMKDYKVKYVFHLAAEPYIPHCYDNPEKFFDVNVKGTMNLLMACKTFDVKRVVHFSTSEVFGSARFTPMDENHPTLPFSTYAVSKLAADRICFVFNHEHKIPVVIIRPFNCYGPRETQPYVIPEIISQLSKTNIVKLGNVDAKRDFTYVDDIVQGIVHACDHVATSNPDWDSDMPDPGTSRAPYRLYNIGNQAPIELMHYIEVIEDCLGRKAEKNLLPLLIE